jgi:uncharacterized membrane protein YebE (DUF533 family)
MKTERPNAQQLTPEETKELDHLRSLIEKAIADGVVTKQESINIKAMVLRNKPGYELLSQELTLYRELVTNKINAGLLKEEDFSDF